jgi:hypothetical protein
MTSSLIDRIAQARELLELDDNDVADVPPDTTPATDTILAVSERAALDDYAAEGEHSEAELIALDALERLGRVRARLFARYVDGVEAELTPAERAARAGALVDRILSTAGDTEHVAAFYAGELEAAAAALETLTRLEAAAAATAPATPATDLGALRSRVWTRIYNRPGLENAERIADIAVEELVSAAEAGVIR